MESWRLGDTHIIRIEELYGPLFDPERFYPDYSLDLVEKHRGWLLPDHLADNGYIMSSIHSWLVVTPDHKILVDSCIGNDKDRMPFRDWDHMSTPYMSRLTATGVTPADIDFVMCTHLHVDHVGWNTVLRDGRWVPTFPNAKYVFSTVEFEHWQAEREADTGEAFHAVNNKTFDDSVLPIMGQATLIDGIDEIVPDVLRIDPAPGHTPGSIKLALDAGGDSALFTGDILHHPLQVYEPHMNSNFCVLPEKARATRRAVLEQCVETGALMCPAHFATSFAGRVVESGGGFSFAFEAPTG